MGQEDDGRIASSEDFVSRYNFDVQNTMTSNAVLFSDIRRYRADPSSANRKNVSITIGENLIDKGSQAVFFKSRPTTLKQSDGRSKDHQWDGNKEEMVEIVDEFRFVIDEKQLEQALQKKSKFVEAKNVGAGVDRG